MASILEVNIATYIHIILWMKDLGWVDIYRVDPALLHQWYDI